METEVTHRKPRHPVPLWSRAISVTVLLIALALLSLTGLHWGGHYQAVAVYGFLAAPVLWFLLAVGIGIAVLRGYEVGDALDGLVFCFIAYAFYHYLTTPAGYAARFEMLWITVYGGLFLALRHLLHSREWVIYLLLGFVLVALINAGFALWNRNDPTPLIWGLERPDYGARVSGTFGCPNHFANFGVMGALTAIFLGTFSRFPWPMRIVLFYLAGIISVGVFLSVSRGGYLAWAAGMGMVSFFAFRAVQVRWWWKLLSVVLVGWGVWMGVTRNDYVMTRWNDFEQGKSVRFRLFQDAITIWKNADSPWLGTGMASFDDFHLRLPYEVQHRAVYTHNDYLNTLSDYGIIGLGLVLAFLVALMVLWWARSRDKPNERAVLVRRLGWAALAAMAVHEMVDFNLHLPACAVAFFIVMGLASAQTYRERPPLGAGWRRVPGVLMALAALVMAIGFVPKIFQTMEGIRILNVPGWELADQEAEAVMARGEAGFRVDPNASDYLVRYGDVLRVKAARLRRAVPGESATERVERLRRREELGRQSLLFYDRALRGSPMDDSLLVRKALTLDAMGRHDEAYMHYEAAIGKRPHSRFFIQHMAYHLLRRGYVEQGKAYLERAVALPKGTSTGDRFLQGANRDLQLIRRAMRPTQPQER